MGELEIELFEQSHYDLDVAKVLFKEEKYPYAVFLCHLAIEKALKAVYYYHLNKKPPKTHNLIYLIEEINLNISDQHLRSIMRINRVQIESRYPDNLKKLLMDYDRQTMEEILNQSEEITEWLRNQLIT